MKLKEIKDINPKDEYSYKELDALYSNVNRTYNEHFNDILQKRENSTTEDVKLAPKCSFVLNYN